MKRILVAGIGNIFLGDDAFGVETIRQLRRCELPEEVRVVDFGIRSYDFAYAIAEGYEAVIMMDAAPRKQPPGTLFLIEPDPDGMEYMDSEAINPHTMNPVAVLQMVQALGGKIGRLYLIGCEPGDLGGRDGKMGLSKAVREAVPKAVEMTRNLITELLAVPSLAGTDTGMERG